MLAVIASIEELNAACTVAFGIQAKAMNARSLILYFPSKPVTKNATNHRIVIPVKMVTNASPMSEGSNFAKRIDAPTDPKRHG